METITATNGSEALSGLPAGRRAFVHSLTGGRDFCSRVANLGFTTGAPVAVVQNYGRGPMLVSVRGTLVALGRTEAGRVFVRAQNEGCQPSESYPSSEGCQPSEGWQPCSAQE